MAGLIPRFYDTVEGSLLLDGKDTKTLKIEDLRKNISMVCRMSFFSTVPWRIISVLENPRRVMKRL
jgi:ABC-type transport system involved in Fe-S cluster assembly fused permease/ATPase subunit